MTEKMALGSEAVRRRLEELIRDIQESADDCRVTIGVPCQSEYSWHANTYQGWADKLREVEALLASEVKGVPGEMPPSNTWGDIGGLASEVGPDHSQCESDKNWLRAQRDVAEEKLAEGRRLFDAERQRMANNLLDAKYLNPECAESGCQFIRASEAGVLPPCHEPLGYETVMSGLDWRCTLPKGHDGSHSYSPWKGGLLPAPRQQLCSWAHMGDGDSAAREAGADEPYTDEDADRLRSLEEVLTPQELAERGFSMPAKPTAVTQEAALLAAGKRKVKL